MSVIRIKKSRREPFVMLDITALTDVRLSFRAKGLHTYLMAKPDNWQVYIEQLEHQSPREGRDAIRSALKELEDAGYIARHKVRGPRGQMAGWDTTVYETPSLAQQDPTSAQGYAAPIGLSDSTQPKSGQPKSDLPISDQPKSGQPKSDLPTSANPQLLSIDLNQGLKVPRIEERTPLPPTVSHSEETPLVAKTHARPKKAHGHRTDYTPGFLAWWDTYPADRRVSKPECFAVWTKEQLEARTEDLTEKLKRLKLTTWKTEERRYVKTSLPYLREGRYEDDLMPLEVVQQHQVRERLSEREYKTLLASQRFEENLYGPSGCPPISGSHDDVIDHVQYRAY